MTTFELRIASTEADHSSRRDRLTTSRSDITDALAEAPYTVKATFTDRAEALAALSGYTVNAHPMRNFSGWVLDVCGAYVAELDDDGDPIGCYDVAALPDLPESWSE